MKAQGVNIIIAVGHSGYKRDKEIAKQVPEVDVVVGGHSNSFLYLNMTDTHNVLSYDGGNGTNDEVSEFPPAVLQYFVIAKLCAVGQTATLTAPDDETKSVCSVNDMGGISFTCGATCPVMSYLFTRWEPECHSCSEKEGVTCNGGHDVVLEYAYWAKISEEEKPLGTLDSTYCQKTFETYLCPSGLCCNNIDGCQLNIEDPTTFCAAHRDPNVPFCGRCMPGYSEVVGTYECQQCDEDKSWILVIPVISGIVLLIYLYLKNPRTVTPLFTYIYKSLLYFYQIIPILTYETNLGLFSDVTALFNLSFVYNILGTSSGTCLFGGMSGVDKLASNFLAPCIILAELLVLRAIPEIIKWACSFTDKGVVVFERPISRYSSIASGPGNYGIQLLPPSGPNASLLENDFLSGDSIESASSYELTTLSLGESVSKETKRKKPRSRTWSTASIVARQSSLNWAEKIRKNFRQVVWNGMLYS